MDKEISNEELYSVLNKVKDFNHSDPITFFEITSSAFFEAASKSPADYTLLEVGLGGRLDSSNNSCNYKHYLNFYGSSGFFRR